LYYRITNIRLGLDEKSSRLLQAAAVKLAAVPPADIEEYRIIRKALDARKKNQLQFVYTIDVRLSPRAAGKISRRRLKDVAPYWEEAGTAFADSGPAFTAGIPAPDSRQPAHGDATVAPPENAPVVIGAGPAGIFAALTLAASGFRPVVLERGQDVDTRTADIEDFWLGRVLKPDSNVQFGEGGAGTFSDGKLTTRINDPRVRRVLKAFVEAGAPEEILYLSKPHIGTDVLRTVVKNLRLKLESMGGRIIFGARVSDLLITGDRVEGLIINEKDELKTRQVVLAIGHSARDTYAMLARKSLKMEPKAFSVGVRVEHPQALIDGSQYGSFTGHPALGSADYQLVYKNKDLDRAAYTFCMCPGGQVVAAASEEGMVVTNGMSNYARNSGVANSAVVVSVGPDDYPGSGALSGVEFQRGLERGAFALGGGKYNAPAQLMEDFLAGRASTTLDGAATGPGHAAADGRDDGVAPTYRPGVTPADLHECLPDYVSTMLEEAFVDFDRRLRNFNYPKAVLTGVETRTSAPLRIVRLDDLQADGVKGLYPAGEGAGYAGGIISAAVDGIRVAEAIIENSR
jgi:uncharacterized FAD-dependent dehydrogenase